MVADPLSRRALSPLTRVGMARRLRSATCPPPLACPRRRPFGARRRTAQPETGRNDSAPRVRAARSRNVRISLKGECRDGRRSNRVLLAAGAKSPSGGRCPAGRLVRRSAEREGGSRPMTPPSPLGRSSSPSAVTRKERRAPSTVVPIISRGATTSSRGWACERPTRSRTALTRQGAGTLSSSTIGLVRGSLQGRRSVWPPADSHQELVLVEASQIAIFVSMAS